MIRRTSVILITCFTYLFAPAAASGPVVVFENDSVFIKADTAFFFALVDKNYAGSPQNKEHHRLIRSEVLYRLGHSDNNEALMDGMNLKCFYGEDRRSYLASCLNYGEAMALLNKGKAMVFRKKTGIAITRIKIKKRGSRLTGKIDLCYIDKNNNKIFLRKTVYEHKWWIRRKGCLPHWTN